MNAAILNLCAQLLTCAVVGASWRMAARSPEPGLPQAATPARRRMLIAGAAAIAVWTACRDTAILALMHRAGVAPWTYLFVDVACLVPYVLGAPRAARAAAQARIPALAGWAAAFLFGALAPVIYLGLAMKGAGGAIPALTAAYLAVVLAAGVYGLRRNTRPVSADA